MSWFKAAMSCSIEETYPQANLGPKISSQLSTVAQYQYAISDGKIVLPG